MRRLLVVVLIAALTAACGDTDEIAAPSTTTTAAMFPVMVRTASGQVTIPRKPVRIVSLSPTATETLYAIGAGPQIVAVDKNSNFPAHAPTTDLSGFKLDVAAIAAHNPDLVVTSRDEPDTLQQLASAQLLTLSVPAAKDTADALAQIEQLGQATGHRRAASELIRSMSKAMNDLTKEVPDGARELTYYYEISPRLHAATSATFIGSILSRLKLRSIADGAGGAARDYPQLTSRQVIEANPDLVILADTKCCQQSEVTVAARPGWSKLKAVQNHHVVALDDEIASRWGPRTPVLMKAVADAAAEVRAQA